MESTRFVVIGLGRLGQELLPRLSREFDLTVVEMGARGEEKLADLRREDVRLIKGDATSRLVLESAGVEDADAVIVSTTTERVNLEVVRVLTEHFHPRRIIAVGITEAGTEQMLASGVEVVNIFAASAIGIRNLIEHKTKAAHAIGIGKDEILEVEVHPHSRLANKPLGFLKPLRWRTGIIYREGNIIVPRGDTILKARDRVVILGDPAVLRHVAEIMTYNYEKFPLEYGETFVACISGLEDASYIEELNYIYSVLPLKRALLVLPPTAQLPKFRPVLEALNIPKAEIKKTSLPPHGALRDALNQCGGSQGLVALSDAYLRSIHSSFFGARQQQVIKSLIREGGCPVVLCRGTHPYERMVLPCMKGVDFPQIMETALQLSQDIGARVTTLQVAPSPYIADEEEVALHAESRQTISNLSLMYKAKVETRHLEGNPVKAMLPALEGQSLMVTGMHGTEEESLLRFIFHPDVAWHLTRRARLTTLLLPPWQEAL